MEISELDFRELGESPSFDSTEDANYSLVRKSVTREEPFDKKLWKRKCSKWNRPIAKVYSDNFGFSVNGYQPMIDFLDYKDSGGRSKGVEVHLPYLEERCINRYSSRNPFSIYKNSDIDRFIEKGERIRTQIRQNDAAGTNSILNRTHTNWSMTRKSVQNVKYSRVIDPRKKKGADGDTNNNESNLYSAHNLTLAGMASIISLGIDPIVASRVAQCKIDHENSRVSRKSRSDEIDNQVEDAIKSMRHTVETIPQPSFSARGPYGEVLVQDCYTNADDMVMRNRIRREEDLNSLKAHVDRITRYDDNKSVLRSNQGLRDGEVMSDLSYLRKRQANTAHHGLGAQLNRILEDKTTRKPYASDAIDNLEDDVVIDYLMKRQLNPVSIEDYRTPMSTLRYKADNISEVQERVHNRANQMIGNTAATRKISDRAKYLNVMNPAPETSEFNLMITPTRTTANIDYMARGFALRGQPVRSYDVDEELYEPRSSISAGSYMDYYTRNKPGPGEKLQSDYARVRGAESRAKERTSLLGL